MTWMQLGLALLTVLGSGVTSAAVTYLLNVRKAEKDLRLTKLEALFQAVNVYTSGLETGYDEYRLVIVGALDLGKFRELHNESARETAPAYETIEVLISIYFSPLKAPFEAVLRATDKIGEVSEYPRRPCTNDETVFKTAMFDFMKEVALLKMAICVEAAKLNGMSVSQERSRLFWRAEPHLREIAEEAGSAPNRADD